MKKLLLACTLLAVACSSGNKEAIDRQALVTRNNPVINTFDPLSSLSVGNGSYTFTVDVTGLQTFPDLYAPGVPLGNYSEWGWHSFSNPEKFTHDETLVNYDFGRGREEPYAVQPKTPERNRAAAEWFRVNPHRMHLGYVGFELAEGAKPEDLSNVQQTLNLWEGAILSSFSYQASPVTVKTVCDTVASRIAASVNSPLLANGGVKVNLRFPYPSGGHSDNATDWNSPEKHTSKIIDQGADWALIERSLDDTVYYVQVKWEGAATLSEKAPHYFLLTASTENLALTCEFSKEKPAVGEPVFAQIEADATAFWNHFWKSGGAIDFSACTDPRAKELERRVILSQYIMRTNNCGTTPPAESGLTYNTWYGRPHLEMHWWHGVHNALWGRPDLLEKGLPWYADVALEPARGIAKRQGFDGMRWMKMTDPWAGEAPSGVGSFLIWQQPHFIYFAELMYRANPSPETVAKYKDLVFEDAAFMASFPSYEELEIRYILKGYIPAQETLRAAETINSPFELSYWHWALTTAQQWRERAGMAREPKWDLILDKLSPLAALDGKYLASEDAVDTYSDVRFTTDHPIVLGALGILPQNKLMNPEIMKNTFDWIYDNWNWGRTWGWDFPMVAMSAARLGMPDRAIDALLMDKRTNTYLLNGHNYQDDRLRIYLPGNGGLLTAVAMMCAGWDGSEGECPGFPQDGTWNVKWEGLQKMP